MLPKKTIKITGKEMKFIHCLEIGKPLETHDFPLYREKDESPAQIELSSIP